MPNQAKTLLKSVFGYDEFRPLQAEVIEHILQRNDALVVMPTGGGKSLCYQIPALIFEGLTIVVSPLISLMKDQVEQLQQVGVSAILLNSSLSPRAYSENLQKIKNREVRLLYVAPETLLKQNILTLLESVPVDCLTIDEAHCISEWGHDFRPEYRQIARVRQRFPGAVCVALTATATPRVQEDICASLHIEQPRKFIASFNRENLFLRVAAKVDPFSQTLEFLQQFPNQSGIIYCFSRKQVEMLADSLAARSFSVRPYHAGLADEVRKQNQELFIRDDVQIIVATIAFGMGINKSNVRFVIHYDLPKSIESYYQEIGRAGRDGLRAECLLLFGMGDTQKIRYFIDQKEDPQQRRTAYYHLDKLVDYAETGQCRRIPLIRYFGEDYQATECEMCDNCTQEKQEQIDLTIAAQKFFSCIYRTGQLFGSGHIIDVLRGSEAQKVIQHGHHNLSTYGIGLEYSKKQWAHLARQFVRQGYLSKDPQYGSLKLNEKSRLVLGGKEKFYGTLQEDVQHRRSAAPETYDSALFELLRRERKRLADLANTPPYVIFSDKTLSEMAAYFPQSEQSLTAIHGVGAAKLEKYGESFLAIIRDYCSRKGIAERPKSGPAAFPQPRRRVKGLSRTVQIGEAFNSGRSIPELMQEHGIKLSTLLSHLYKFLQDGRPLRNGDFLSHSRLSPEQQRRVLQVFEQLGAERLRPVFDAFDGKIAYDELHLLRLHFLSR